MKTITLLFIVLSAPYLHAQVEGPYNPTLTANSNLSGFVQSWIKTDQASGSDDLYTSFDDIPGVGQYTDYLIVQKFNFNIPDGATIKGIMIDIERSDPQQQTADYSIRIIKEGVITGTEKSTGLAYPASDAYQTYGGATDLWGETWGFKNINGGNFGVAIAAQRNATGGTTSGQIDDVRITIFYGFVTLPLNLHSFHVTKSTGKVILDWATSSESGMDRFVIERSGNGNQFEPVYTLPCLNQPTATYSYTDVNPLPGSSYYRLRMEESSGEKNYSMIQAVHFSKPGGAVLYPSPWTRGSDLYVNNTAKELLTVRFYDVSGHFLGKTITNTGLVSIPFMPAKKGIVYYKIADNLEREKGNGSLTIN